MNQENIEEYIIKNSLLESEFDNFKKKLIKIKKDDTYLLYSIDIINKFIKFNIKKNNILILSISKFKADIIKKIYINNIKDFILIINSSIKNKNWKLNWHKQALMFYNIEFKEKELYFLLKLPCDNINDIISIIKKISYIYEKNNFDIRNIINLISSNKTYEVKQIINKCLKGDIYYVFYFYNKLKKNTIEYANILNILEKELYNLNTVTLKYIKNNSYNNYYFFLKKLMFYNQIEYITYKLYYAEINLKKNKIDRYWIIILELLTYVTKKYNLFTGK